MKLNFLLAVQYQHFIILHVILLFYITFCKLMVQCGVGEPIRKDSLAWEKQETIIQALNKVRLYYALPSVAKIK